VLDDDMRGVVGRFAFYESPDNGKNARHADQGQHVSFF
jgi:hypothetical protein